MNGPGAEPKAQNWTGFWLESNCSPSLRGFNTFWIFFQFCKKIFGSISLACYHGLLLSNAAKFVISVSKLLNVQMSKRGNEIRSRISPDEVDRFLRSFPAR